MNERNVFHRSILAPLKSRSGFTFLEATMAIAILTSVMAGGCRLIASIVRLRTASHNHYTATLIANNRIERAKHISLSELPLLAEKEVAVNSLGVPQSDGRYRRSTVVQPGHDGDARVTLIQVTVQTPILLRAGQQRPSESVSTLLTEYVEL